MLTYIESDRFEISLLELGGTLMSKIKRLIGTKEFYKIAIAVALPLMLQQLITSSVNLVDNLMVGQLGGDALSGVASVNRFYLMATFATNGLLASAAIYIAQYYGAGHTERTKESFRFSLVFALGIMIFFFLLGLIIPTTIVDFFTDDPQIIALGVEYLTIAKFTFIPMAITLSLSSALRAVGEMKVPLFVSVIAVATNTFLNYCFIFGNFGFPELGVQGAALATLIARVLESLILLCALKKCNVPFKTKISEIFHISSSIMKRITSKAAPLTTNELLWQAGMATLFMLYSTRGAEVMAGYSIANTVSDIFFVLFAGMAAASTVLISHRLGANNLEEARDNGYRLLGFSVLLSCVFAILMYASSFFITDLYQVSEESKEVARTLLTVMSCMFWIYMINTQCYFILRAGGDVKSTLFIDSVYMWTINIPLVAAVTYFTGVNVYVLYIVGQATDLLKMVICIILVKREKWVVNLAHHD